MKANEAPEPREALHEAIAEYASAMGYGVVTKWVLACETNDGHGPVMRHRSGDMEGQSAAPWDELALHQAGVIFADREIRQQADEASG